MFFNEFRKRHLGAAPHARFESRCRHGKIMLLRRTKTHPAQKERGRNH